MADNAQLILLTALMLVGVAGGIPQILHWIKTKPTLRITRASISKLPGNSYKYQVLLEVQNQTRWWKRNGDASNVTADYYIIDNDVTQCACGTSQLLAPYLVAGAKVRKETEAYHTLMPEGNPYTFIFRVTCSEGITDKHTITYQATQTTFD